MPHGPFQSQYNNAEFFFSGVRPMLLFPSGLYFIMARTILHQFLLQREMFQTNVVETNRTGILCSITFFLEHRTVYEIIRKNIVEPGGSQVVTWSMRISH